MRVGSKYLDGKNLSDVLAVYWFESNYSCANL